MKARQNLLFSLFLIGFMLLPITNKPVYADSGALGAGVVGAFQGLGKALSDIGERESQLRQQKELMEYQHQLDMEQMRRRDEQARARQEDERKRQETARIEAEKQQREKEANAASIGSGFFVTSDGYFVTNYHVVKDAGSITLLTINGNKKEGKIVRVDRVNDLALIKVDGRFSALPITSSRAARRGQSVATVGYPHADVQGVEPKVTEGVISSLSGIADDPRIFQISVPVQSGNSGGPLVTREGNVIGIIVSKLSVLAMLKQTGDMTQNVNYAIKSNYLLELLSSEQLDNNLPHPNKKTRNLEDVTNFVEKATALVVARPQKLAKVDNYKNISPNDRKGTEQALPSTGQAKEIVIYRDTLKEESALAAANGPKPGTTFHDCADCPEMVVIPAGSFEMGETGSTHRVTLKSYALGKTEVTQGQWKAIMGNNPSKFTSCGDDCPVEKVSWYDAQAYIQKLNAKTGKHYRLPSESEWEYACRAGSRNEYCGSDNLDSVAWYTSNSASTTHRVATKQANAFGLNDMSGNVWEWVEDSYHGNYNGAPLNGSAWAGDGAKRGLRGGSWKGRPQVARATDRGWFEPADRDNGSGFRLAMLIKG